MNNQLAKEVYQKDPYYWPGWLTAREQEDIITAAEEGENARKNIVIISGMLYLGLSPKEAADIRWCTVNGDAIENKDRTAFLHIPNAYRQRIYQVTNDIESIVINRKLIDCTKEEAEKAAEDILLRAGFSAKIGILRIRRTAARLHYICGYTDEGNILKWFSDIRNIFPEKRKVLFYREKTDEEQQNEIDETIMKMVPFV